MYIGWFDRCIFGQHHISIGKKFFTTGETKCIRCGKEYELWEKVGTKGIDEAGGSIILPKRKA